MNPRPNAGRLSNMHRSLMRTIRLPRNVAQRLFGAPRPARSARQNVWVRLLISFRSAGPTEPGDDPSASALNQGVRVVLIPLARAYARLLRRFSTRDVFVPTDRIDWVTHLESNWQVVRDELDRLRAGFDLPALIDVIPGEQYVTDARWKMFMFRYFGRPIESNCSLCPRTAGLLDRIPGLISANFSVLEPGARIAAHHGIFAGVLRYHLGLIVPARANQCGLRVAGETRQWREGASLLFDDTHRHEAWNDTNEDRVVLLLDVKRPLPAPVRWVNDATVLLLSRMVMQPLAQVDRMIPQVALCKSNGS